MYRAHAILSTRATLVVVLILVPAALVCATEFPQLPAARLETSNSHLFATELGGRVTARSIPLDGKPAPVDLELRRLRVFAEDAKIVVHSEKTEWLEAPPNNLYFTGNVMGVERSRVFLTVREGGAIRGVVSAEGSLWIVSAVGRDTPLTSRKVAAGELKASGRTFNCGADEITPKGEGIFEYLVGNDDNSVASLVAGKQSASYTARVAVETDWEFFQIFGNTSDAIDYVGDLIGYASGIYGDEVDTTLVVQEVSIWTTSSDPWDEMSTICGLFEFGQYWNHHNGDVNRTIAHFMSGKSLGGGIAWTGVLCSAAFNPAPWGYTPSALGCSTLTPDSDFYGGGYGFTANITGGFDPSSPSPVWDIISVTHEIGHNFNSPHTHCFKNIGGNVNPVDECYAGDECVQDPGSCNCNTPKLPCSQPGSGCGTIMSYCHMLSGGFSNISLTLGEGHSYGVQPERVPARMSSHVISVASSNPSCLAFTENDSIFTDDLESGGTETWSSTVP